ncbi:MAG: SlyX family protein [Opitutaceae bacterium]
MNDASILRLEERVAWLEKHVVEQDKAMLEMADDLSRMKKQILDLRERATSQSADGQLEDSAVERPPHY